MPKQIQAQQQTVIVKVAAPEKKRRKRTKKRKPRQPTGEEVFQSYRPTAVYQPLFPREDYGSQFRELLSTVSMIQAKQDALGSFIPEYVRRPSPTDIVMAERPAEEAPELNPAPVPETVNVATTTEPISTAEATTTTSDAPMTKNQITNFTKFAKKVNFSVKLLKKGEYSNSELDDLIYLIEARSQSQDKAKWVSYVKSFKS